MKLSDLSITEMHGGGGVPFDIDGKPLKANSDIMKASGLKRGSKGKNKFFIPKGQSVPNPLGIYEEDTLFEGVQSGQAGSPCTDEIRIHPREVYQYLRSKNISHNHVLGMLANIKGESSFDPCAFGDKVNGKYTSGGFFQHHGSRFSNMVTAVGQDWQRNWQGQIDFALSEQRARDYLAQQFNDPFEATKSFLINFESPLFDKNRSWDQRAQERMNKLQGHVRIRYGETADLFGNEDVHPYQIQQQQQQDKNWAQKALDTAKGLVDEPDDPLRKYPTAVGTYLWNKTPWGDKPIELPRKDTDQVKQIQTDLQGAGYDLGPDGIDGNLGYEYSFTRKAIKDYNANADNKNKQITIVENYNPTSTPNSLLNEYSDMPKYLYHATFTKNVERIKKQGLLQFETSLWVKGPGGSRYNEDAGIFAFDHPEDALNWAGKMEWEFRNQDPDISIVRIEMEEFWGDDPAEDPFFGKKGKALRSARNISADKIIDSITMNELGKPGELGISRDDWLKQTADKLSEGWFDNLKNKVRVYNPEFKVGWDSEGEPTANVIWQGKFDKDFSRYDKDDWVNPNKKKRVNPDKQARVDTTGKLTKTSTGYRMTEASQKYYHGSFDKMEIGEILTPGEDDYEENWGHNEWYQALHKHRPIESRQHSWSVFMVADEDDIDLAGGADDYVYVVEPVGNVEKHDLNWASEISYLLDQGHDINSNEVKEAAINYWTGQPHTNESVWEYLAPKAKIVGVLADLAENPIIKAAVKVGKAVWDKKWGVTVHRGPKYKGVDINDDQKKHWEKNGENLDIDDASLTSNEPDKFGDDAAQDTIEYFATQYRKRAAGKPTGSAVKKPLLVTPDPSGKGHLVLDGNHRLFGARAAGYKTHNVRVIPRENVRFRHRAPPIEQQEKHVYKHKQEKMAEAKEKLTLEKLPYAKNALAPVMSKETIDYHYGKLAKGYVDKFNSGEGDAKFNKAGAFLHNIFFPQLQAPKTGNKPSGISLDLINDKYGSFDKFKEEFTNTAMSIQGAGWIYMSKTGAIKTIKNHAIRTDIALLVDWWEHAWTLDYQSNKGKYCANIWRIINWDVVNEKLGQPLNENVQFIIPDPKIRRKKQKQDQEYFALKGIEEQSTLFEAGAGDCFAVAGKTMIEMGEEQNVKLIHAYVYGQGELEGRRFPHAWNEMGDVALDYSNGNKIVMRKEQYYSAGRVTNDAGAYATYNSEDSMINMLKHGHWGPWDLNDMLDEEIPDEANEIGKQNIRISKDDLNLISLKRKYSKFKTSPRG